MKRSYLSIPLVSLSTLGLVSCEIGTKVVEEATATEPRTPSYFETVKEKEEATTLTTATYGAPPGPPAATASIDVQYLDVGGKAPVDAPTDTASVAETPVTQPEAPVTQPETPAKPAPVTPEVGATDDVAPAPAEGMMNLVTEFPTPMFVGTPVPVKLPNLEKPGKPKKTMPVPAGTKNVASNKPVTSSDPEPTIGELNFVTDGDKEGGDGYFVELGPGTQWIQIDLEKEFDIHALFFWHFHKSACAYFDVIAQISNDPEFVEATTVYNNDHDNSSGLGVGADLAYIETNHGRLVDAKGTKGRYVRLYSNGNTANDLNHYIEIEVYATE